MDNDRNIYGFIVAEGDNLVRICEKRKRGVCYVLKRNAPKRGKSWIECPGNESILIGLPGSQYGGVMCTKQKKKKTPDTR